MGEAIDFGPTEVYRRALESMGDREGGAYHGQD